MSLEIRISKILYSLKLRLKIFVEIILMISCQAAGVIAMSSPNNIPIKAPVLSVVMVIGVPSISVLKPIRILCTVRSYLALSFTQFTVNKPKDLFFDSSIIMMLLIMTFFPIGWLESLEDALRTCRHNLIYLNFYCIIFSLVCPLLALQKQGSVIGKCIYYYADISTIGS